MGWSRQGSGFRRRGYHHGNLREDLIRAALDLIAAKGPGGFTFAEAARAAGVSPAAPYRHFRDRDALLADVAQRGFESFAAALEAAFDQGRPNPMAALEAVGHAYLAFARREPALYAAMFEAAIPPDASPGLRLAADRAFAVLRQAAEALCQTLPEGERPPALMMSLHIWSLAHGIASLFARADNTGRTTPMSAEDLLEAGILVYLKGLGITAAISAAPPPSQ
ncbi:MAG: TetR/AcrR family transcriptional regulator [Aestuariivirgaceae bacterium]